MGAGRVGAVGVGPPVGPVPCCACWGQIRDSQHSCSQLASVDKSRTDRHPGGRSGTWRWAGEPGRGWCGMAAGATGLRVSGGEYSLAPLLPPTLEPHDPRGFLTGCLGDRRRNHSAWGLKWLAVPGSCFWV